MKTITKTFLFATSLATGLAAGPAFAVEPGAAAPDFTLKDQDGKAVHLSDYKGKFIVLEWFNPECPFVKASHTKGSLVSFAKKEEGKGIVWLAVDSGAAGKQGNGADKVKTARATFNLDHPVLLDEAGTVGHAYGATNTPHLFVIGKDQKVLYKGAIDNSPDGEGASPTGGKLVNYVEQALADAASGKPVATPTTKPYGCSVKY